MTTTLVVADLHINSTLGICPSKVTLADGGKYTPNDGQKWLFDSFNDMIHKVHVKTQGELLTVVNGDAVEGDFRKRSVQTITQNNNDVLIMAETVLKPLKDISRGMWFTKGTEAHTGPAAELEETLAQLLKGVQEPKTQRYTWWSLPWLLDKKQIVFSHHPQGGGGGMNKAALVDRIAIDAVFTYANRGETIPDLFIYSHLHQYLDTVDRFRSRVIVTPCWVIPRDAYLHRRGIAPKALADVGGILIHTEGNIIEIEPIRYKPAKAKWVSPLVGLAA